MKIPSLLAYASCDILYTNSQQLLFLEYFFSYLFLPGNALALPKRLLTFSIILLVKES